MAPALPTQKIMKKILTLLTCLFLFVAIGAAQSPRLPLGVVTHADRVSACPSGYYPGATCYQATVTCPNTVDIAVTYGYTNPGGVPRGTVVLLNGADGTQPQPGPPATAGFDSNYLEAGYQIVQTAWASAWEDTGLPGAKSIKAASCRPATLLKYIYQTVYDHNGGMCAQGMSAGSGELAYSLAWYGASDYLDKVELLSGPVFGDVKQGCMKPDANPVTVCPSGQFGCVGESWQDQPQYIGGPKLSLGQWSGDQCQPRSKTTSIKSDASWKSMSIVDGSIGPNFSYPKTAMAGWLCSNGLNNSAAQGEFFYQKFTNPSQVANYSVTRIDNCYGPEGVSLGTTPQGELGLDAITADMTSTVAGCIKRH
jgi:hypothetical protein